MGQNLKDVNRDVRALQTRNQHVLRSWGSIHLVYSRPWEKCGWCEEREILGREDELGEKQ